MLQLIFTAHQTGALVDETLSTNSPSIALAERKQEAVKQFTALKSGSQLVQYVVLW